METPSEIEVTYADIEPPMRWSRIFGNTAPVEIEIGFGKCGFLLKIAADHPTKNFIGIESSLKYYRKGITKVQRAGLTNIRLLWGEALHIFKQYVPDHSIANLYINFPDPWPKRRHAKRRLLNGAMVELLAQKLEPHGGIEIATDAESYMTQIQEIFQANDRYERLVYQTSPAEGTLRPYASDYEVMYLREGKTIHYVKYRTHPGRDH